MSGPVLPEKTFSPFPTVQEQLRGIHTYVDFVDKLILNFSECFDSFRFGQRLTLFIQNFFLVTDVGAFSKEVTRLIKLANAGFPQMQLLDLQADVTQKEHLAKTDPSTFWL